MTRGHCIRGRLRAAEVTRIDGVELHVLELLGEGLRLLAPEVVQLDVHEPWMRSSRFQSVSPCRARRSVVMHLSSRRWIWD